MNTPTRYITAVIILTLTVVGVAVISWWPENPNSTLDQTKEEAPSPPARRNVPTPLKDDPQKLVGEWNRIELLEKRMIGHWRAFTAKGEFRVGYGCVIHSGTFSYIDETTIETHDDYDGPRNRWTVSRTDDKLVMVHQKWGWIEKFEPVPLGTLGPWAVIE